MSQERHERMHERMIVARGEEEPCAYLPEERARMDYRAILGCEEETYQELLERGWRRFGLSFFRPACRACHACRGLRVDVEAFRETRSMRRTRKRNGDLTVLARRPTVTSAHLDLYHRFHAERATSRGWRFQEIDVADYREAFVEGRERFGREVLYLFGEKLVAVALADVLPRAVSAIYCFYDPALASRSLGVFSVLKLVDLARNLGVPYLYLGFLIEANRSMRYKARYRPHEILEGRPGEGEAPRWRPAGDLDGPAPADVSSGQPAGSF